MSQKSINISTFLQSRIDEGDFPSAVYLVAENGQIILHDALGFAVVDPERIKANTDTIYDLASLTKVLVTGLLCAKLVENGEINLSDKLSKYFVEFNTEEKREIAIQNLLVHTSGIRAWLPLYLITDSKAQILDAISRESLENPINSKVVYSDLNFLILTFLIEKIFAGPIDEIAKSEIFQPLELKNTFYNPPKELRKRIAANEKGNEFEKNICIENGYKISDKNFLFRNHIIWGEVHDGNCYYMNGVSGHAGLFSTAEEVFRIAQQFLPNETRLLNPETCKLFQTNFTPKLNEARSFAFQLAETPDSSAGKALKNNSFGHLGFTGNSLWIETQTDRVFILLTNRTHAREFPFVILNSVRRKFHELAVSMLDGK